MNVSIVSTGAAGPGRLRFRARARVRVRVRVGVGVRGRSRGRVLVGRRASRSLLVSSAAEAAFHAPSAPG